MTPARYYWLEHDAARRRDEKALASVWKSRAIQAQEAPGFESLPTTFPAYTKLTAAGVRYVSVADLDGVSGRELLADGLSEAEVTAVLEALSSP